MKDYQESTFLYHESCPKCGSSDACGVFSDGHRYCYSCNSYFRADGKVIQQKESVVCKECIPLDDLDVSYLSARKINQDTCSKFKYMVGDYKGTPCQVANYYDDNGNIVGQKLRFPDKSFAVLGKLANHLFGSQLWSSGKKIVITEGEIDCLTVSQLQSNKWPVVSIPNGAQAAKKAIEANLEYLDRFEEVVLMFDMDEPGRKACEECAKVLPAGKAFIANLPLKDPNECLLEGKGSEVIQAIWNAKPYRPDGIVAGTDLYEKCVTDIDDLKDSVEYPWVALQNKTKGARHGELYVFTSGSGMGSPQFSENSNTTLAFTGENYAELLLLKNLLAKLGWNSCRFILASDSSPILSVQMKMSEAELFRRLLGTENSSCTTILGLLIQVICLVNLGT